MGWGTQTKPQLQLQNDIYCIKSVYLPYRFDFSKLIMMGL